jgi:hypothetical protein
VRRDGKGDLPGDLKISGVLHQRGRIEAINVKNSLSRRLGDLRSAGEQKGDQEAVESGQWTVGSDRSAPHDEDYTGAL